MNDFIAYLNSTNNIGGNSTGSLAETQVKSPYYDSVKIDRKIGTRMYQEIVEGKYKTYILTGHAGDGKTSILVQVLKSLGYLQQGEGLDVSHEYSNVFYVKDILYLFYILSKNMRTNWYVFWEMKNLQHPI